jgi:hypothetical protein
VGITFAFVTHLWHKGIEPISHRVQVIRKEVGVNIERHGGRGVAQYLLHDFNVRPGLDCQ